jgi:glycosyltransferase involved in cell wall biosynthesis
MKKLAIITTHPIQYYAPVFQLLHQRRQINIKVFYTWGEVSLTKHDPGFNKIIHWDIPLLEGYPFEWVKNTSRHPGSHHFNGIVNPDLTHQIKQLNPDAILFFGWAYQGHLKAIRYFKNKIPVYFRGDSTLLDEKKNIKGLLRNVFLKLVYRNIDHAFYTGLNNKAYFKKFGLQDVQLTFAPHAIDNERFSADRQNEALALRQELGLSKADLLVLFAGKFEEKKDPLLLLETFLQLERKNCHLLLVGNGVLEDTLKSLARNNARVHFMDTQNQSFMPVIYQASNLFCLPSKGPGETWGLAVNEAMACGKAVLTSDKAGCAADLVVDGQNGAVFKAGDAESLAACLNALTADQPQLAVLGERSKALIKDWNFLNIAKAIEQKLLDEAN